MAGRRDSFVLQAHLCTIWKDGQYERTRDIGEVRQSFEDQLARLGTSWVDIAMIHYVDSVSDWNAVESGEVMHYAQALRREGRARAVGLSSHNPAAARLAVESGKISTSLIQRRLSLGYGRAAKLVDRMEQMGIVSPPEGQKPRAVLISEAQWMERKLRRDPQSEGAKE